MPQVYIPPLLRELTDGHEIVEIPGTTVRQIVTALDHRFPGIKDRLCDGEGLRPGLSVAVDGRVSSMGLIQKVGEMSEVHFIPAIGGG